jgi:hypothetical protein
LDEALQTAPLEPAVNGCQNLLGLLLTLEVDDNVVDVTLERDLWKVPLGPDIERIVQAWPKLWPLKGFSPAVKTVAWPARRLRQSAVALTVKDRLQLLGRR